MAILPFPLALDGRYFAHLRAFVENGGMLVSDAWHEHGVKALCHSDGNWRKVIPDLIETGVDLLERGTPAQVREEARRHIVETRAIETGGMFVASSSEINPPIPPENFKALVDAVGENSNPSFCCSVGEKR